MHRHLRDITIGAAVATLIACPVLWLRGAEKNAAAKSSKPAAQTVDLFAGIENGDLQVKFIAKNDREAQVLIKNNTKQPLSVKLPSAFVGVPVLAQAVGGLGVGANNNNNNNNNANQTAGGGFGGGGLGGGGGFGGGGFNVAPEAVGKLKVPLVCLEHGKKDPNARVPYEIRPVESFTKDARVQELLTVFGEGKLNPRAAQAAAWHFANGMSWQELAAKKIDRLGKPDEPYFSPAELQMAAQIATEAERLAKARPAKDESSSSSESESSSLSSAAAVAK